MDKTCDVLVLGGGGAGLTAAARIATLSDLKVTVLEKADFLGVCQRTHRGGERRGVPDCDATVCIADIRNSELRGDKQGRHRLFWLDISAS